MTATLKILFISMLIVCASEAISQQVLIDPSQRLPAIPALTPGYFRNNLTPAGTQHFDAEANRFNCLRTFDLNWKLRIAASKEALITAVRSLRSFHESTAQKTDVLIIQINTMPSWLSSSSDSSRVSPDDNIRYYETVKPADYARWDSLMRDIASVIREWNFTPYYELWNEPDLHFWNGSEAELIELYRHTATAIKAVDPDAQIGGFGMNTWHRGVGKNGSSPIGYYPDSLADITATLAHLIDTCAAYGTPLDFISWHAFSAYPRWIEYGYEYFQRKLAERGFSSTQQLLTEYNASGTYRERKWHAPYILSVIEVMKSFPRFHHAFAAYQDFTFDLGKEFFGEWGGISRSGLKKPVHYALSLLSRVHQEGSARIAAHADVPVIVFAGIAGDTIRTLISNYVVPPQLAGYDALLFGDAQINTGDLLLAGYGGWGEIDSTIQGLTPAKGDARIRVAFQDAQQAYLRSLINDKQPLDIVLTCSGMKWGARGLICRIDSTNNNVIFRYDSLMGLGYSRNQTVSVLAADQLLKTSSVTMSDSTFRFLLPPNGIVYLELYRNTGPVEVTTTPPPGSPLSSYPNPFAEALNLETRQLSTVRITDILGREVWKGSVHDTAVIDATSWTPGVYMILHQNQVRRVVKR